MHNEIYYLESLNEIFEKLRKEGSLVVAMKKNISVEQEQISV